MSVGTAEQAKTHGNLIAGEWRAARGGETFDSVNPARRSEVLGHFARSSRSDIDDAVSAAVAAQPAWARTPMPASWEAMSSPGAATSSDIAACAPRRATGSSSSSGWMPQSTRTQPASWSMA